MAPTACNPGMGYIRVALVQDKEITADAPTPHRRSAGLAHDLEKRNRFFGKDHAQENVSGI